MFKPQYSLSGKLLSAIAKMERFYGQIEALRVPKKLELNLERNNLIQSSYASNKIEGNPLTLPEVTNLLLDDRVPTNRDEKEVVNYFELLSSLEKYQESVLDVDLIKKFHSLLLTGVDKTAGEVRTEKVVVGKYQEEKGNYTLKVKHEPPFHDRKDIESALEELFSWVKSQTDLPAVVLVGIFHHQFVYIHPFEDGNGRVCRLLSTLLFLKRQYQINKLFVLDDYYDIDRMQYSDMLHSADKGDKTEWLEYFAEGVGYSLQSALARFKNAMQGLSVKNRPTPKEREVLEFLKEQKEVTSSDLAKKFEVSRQQAHNLLKSLVDKGLLEQKGSTKSSYYFLK